MSILEGSDDDCDLIVNNEKERMYNNGYRTNKVIQEEKFVQIGFDKGFEKGMEIGRKLGSLSATLRMDIVNSEKMLTESEKLMLLNKMNKIFMIDIPKYLQEDNAYMQANNILLSGENHCIFYNPDIFRSFHYSVMEIVTSIPVNTNCMRVICNLFSV
jgi:hypothetical protein